MMIARRGLLFAAALGLAGCASSPPTNYYRMAALPGANVGAAPVSVGVRSITIPGYLNQTGIAKSSGAYQFASYGNEIWAEPLADMLQNVMVQDLAQRLPAATVIADGGGIQAPSGVLVEMNILRFDPGPDGQIVLTAQVAIKTGAKRVLCATRTLQSTAGPGPGATGTVAAMSTLWAGAADQVAVMVAGCQGS
jgi:uncharacterized lipoprotein YmbA